MNFENSIREWMRLDNEIKAKLLEVKKLKLDKEEVHNNILEYIRENKLEEITIKIGDGKLRLANTNVSQPLSYKFLSETLVDYFEDDGDVVSEIIEYIKEKRPSKTVTELKRFGI